MYLEISPRRSGKTKRLVQAARQAILEGKYINIGTSNIRLLPDDLKEYYRSEITSDMGYVFYDEYEYGLHAEIIHEPSIEQLKNILDNQDTWYIVGTPHFSQSDILKKLLAFQPMYCKHFNYNNTVSNMEIYRKEYKAGILSEVNGEFKID